MKFLGAFLIIIMSAFCLFAQSYNGEYRNVFDFQQPDAISEALGKVQVVQTENPAAFIYNPASSSFNKGFNFQFSYLEPYSMENGRDPKKLSYTVSKNTGKYGTFGFNMQHFSSGSVTYSLWDMASSTGYADNDFIPKINRYCFNYSYSPADDFSFGFNANFFEDKYYKEKSRRAWFFDFGLMKRFCFNNDFSKNTIIVGTSVTNLTQTKIEAVNGGYYIVFVWAGHTPDFWRPTGNSSFNEAYLPTNYRVGASYEFELKKQYAGFNLFSIKALAEYNQTAKSDYFRTVKFGSELNFLETLKLRFGYFKENISDGKLPKYLKENISQFTYGFGVNLPVHKVIKSNVPVFLRFDFAGSEAVNEYIMEMPAKNIYVYNVSLNIGI